MWLLISNGRVMATHDSANAWPQPPAGMTAVEYNGAWPAYADGIAEPNEYLWDGAAPTLGPGRPTEADRIADEVGRSMGALSHKERQLGKLLFLLTNEVRALKGQGAITKPQFIAFVAGL